MRALREAGFALEIDLGVQYAPDWVFRYPESSYLDQNGRRPRTDVVNGVFSSNSRFRIERYLRRVWADIEDLVDPVRDAIRLGFADAGEVGYPYVFGENRYWAYDARAQGSRRNRPANIETCPVPGWMPGQPSRNNEAARAFADWYMRCMLDYLRWQAALAGSLSECRLKMMYPSWGIRPGEIDAAVKGNLSGVTKAERNGETQRGYDFERFVYGLKAPRVVVNTSWLDAPFGDDASPDPAKWSPGHFLGFLAERAGKPCWAENRGGNSLSDMRRCFRRLDAFGIERLSWAFVDQLYEGPDSGFATIDDYERQIAAS